jgi:hypothetical protein
MKPRSFIRDEVLGGMEIDARPRTRHWAAAVWGGALIVLAAVVAWRRARLGEPPGALPRTLGVSALALAGLLALDATGPAIYRAVLIVCATIGWALGHVLMFVFFYLCVTPLGWLLKFMGKDFLDRGPRARPAWKPHAPPPDRKRYFRLF